MKNSMEALQKLKMKLPYDPTIPLLGIYTKECKSGYTKVTCHTHVYCSAIHNSQVMETAKMPHY
jgi:hypothetical protein